ncbi:MAG TPA: DoxX family protein [Edaphocola sp.]|nr:DoxX family protein [Edaphocola sp.]
MSKSKKIIYWIATIWLASGLLAGGVQQLFLTGNFIEIFQHLHYPLYMMRILGTWKVLAAVTILAPNFKLLKEWAYAGSFFVWTGALASHLVFGDLAMSVPAVILIILTMVSWYCRPENRKIKSLNFMA